MKCKIEIDMGNAAFENPHELFDILSKIANIVRPPNRLEGGHCPIFDTNGNRVGQIEIGDAHENCRCEKQQQTTTQQEVYQLMENSHAWLSPFDVARLTGKTGCGPALAYLHEIGRIQRSGNAADGYIYAKSYY